MTYTVIQECVNGCGITDETYIDSNGECEACIDRRIDALIADDSLCTYDDNPLAKGHHELCQSCVDGNYPLCARCGIERPVYGQDQCFDCTSDMIRESFNG